MGAAPSRETHRRMMDGCPYLKSVGMPGGPTVIPASARKNDIVLLPLTKLYFPSPDCPLFVQFHQARCDAAVNYYLRRPGNPGPLDSIPLSHMLPHEYTAEEMRSPDHHHTSGSHKSEDQYYHATHMSYPSREALYRGVVERLEETLFDTDAEMREAYQFARSHPNTTMGPDGKKQRPVLPVLCAVAFRTDPNRVHSRGGGGSKHAAPHHNGSSAEGECPAQETKPEGLAHGCPHLAALQSAEAANRTTAETKEPTLSADPFAQIQAEHGVILHGSLLHVVGCFGFVSISEEVAAAHNEKELKGDHCRPPAAAPLASMVYLTKSAGEQNLGRVSYIAASTYYFQMVAARVIQRCPPVVAEPSAGGAAGTPVSSGPLRIGQQHRCHHMLENMDTSSLMEDSASESSPLTPFPLCPAAAGVGDKGHGNTIAPQQSTASSALPPMDTFSFSTLLTNIPILSFLYEMKWRWGYLGIIKAQESQSQPPPQQPNTPLGSSMGMDGSPGSSFSVGRGCPHPSPPNSSSHHSAGGLSGACRYCGKDITEEMEMWITPDHMLHGRISKNLAERLCWSLAECSHILQERVTQLPSEEESYWRYRGLVDRDHPPPLPNECVIAGDAPQGTADSLGREIHPRDVYVMGSNVLPDFDEGDILCFNTEHQVWYADPSIPLEGVVLAAMRPFSKRARESPPEDPHWVTKLVKVSDPDCFIPEPYPLPPPTAAQAAAMAENPKLRLVAERVGHFYVYQFERDGETYYLGTVPNFANPNKKRGRDGSGGARQRSEQEEKGNESMPRTTGSKSSTTVSNTTVNPHSQHHNGNHQLPPEKESGAAGSPPPFEASKYIPTSIASALFSLLPASMASSSATWSLSKSETTPTTTEAVTTTATPSQGGGAAVSAEQKKETTATSPTAASTSSKPAEEFPSFLSGARYLVDRVKSSQLSKNSWGLTAGSGGASDNAGKDAGPYLTFAMARKWLLQRLPSMHKPPPAPPRRNSVTHNTDGSTTTNNNINNNNDNNNTMSTNSPSKNNTMNNAASALSPASSSSNPFPARSSPNPKSHHPNSTGAGGGWPSNGLAPHPTPSSPRNVADMFFSSISPPHAPAHPNPTQTHHAVNHPNNNFNGNANHYPQMSAPSYQQSQHSQSNQSSMNAGYVQNTGCFFPYYAEGGAPGGYNNAHNVKVAYHQAPLASGQAASPPGNAYVPPSYAAHYASPLTSSAAGNALNGVATYPPLPSEYLNGVLMNPSSPSHSGGGLIGGRSPSNCSGSFGGTGVRLTLHRSCSSGELESATGRSSPLHSNPLMKKHSNGSFSWDWRNTPDLLAQLE